MFYVQVVQGIPSNNRLPNATLSVYASFARLYVQNANHSINAVHCSLVVGNRGYNAYKLGVFYLFCCFIRRRSCWDPL